MQINSINSYNYNNYSKNSNSQKTNPSFQKIINVSDVVLDGKNLVKDKQFYLMINRAVKYLKKVENQSIDFVKNFWKTSDSYDTKTLQRTSHYLATSQDARSLTRASHDIVYKYGNTSEYCKMKTKLINDSTKRLKQNGQEKELYIKAHSEKNKKIIIDDIGFKNKGEVLPLNSSDIKNPTNYVAKTTLIDKNGQYCLDLK